MIADGSGRAAAFAPAPGQAHELPQAPALLARLRQRPKRLLAGRGHTSHAFASAPGRSAHARHSPPLHQEAPVACPARVYNNHDQAERRRGRPKERRAAATGHKTTATTFMPVLRQAATLNQIKPAQDLKPI